MTVAQIAAWVLAVLVVGEAIALAVVVRQWRAAEHEADELRRRLDTRNMLFTGGSKAVKTVWQTANILRRDGLGAAVRSSIEELADWAEVERPDLARLAPGGRVAIMPLAKRHNRVLYRTRILRLGKARAYRACRVLKSHQRDCMELKIPPPIELASR